MRSSFAAALFMMAASVEAGSHIGSCSDLNIEGVSDFDQSKIAGRWYTIATDASFYDSSKACENEDYVVNFNGTVTVGKNFYDLTNGWTQKTLHAIQNSNNRGEYATFTATDIADRDANPEFKIVATDYNNWIIEYVCADIIPGKFYFDIVTIKSRTSELSPTNQTLVDAILEATLPHYDTNELFQTSQCKICPYSGIPAVQGLV